MFLSRYYIKKKNNVRKRNHHPLKFVSLLAGIVCSSVVATSAFKYNRQLKDTVPVLYIGEGYLSYDGQGVGQSALDSSVLRFRYGKPQNTLNLSQSMDRSQLSTDLNVGVSGSVGWGLFSASASANYMKNTKDDAYAQNINYGESYTVDKYIASALTPTIKGLSLKAQALYHTDPTRFTRVYGDNFVYQVTEGVLLLVDVKLAFASSEDKQKFDASMSASYGSFGSISGEVSTAESESHAKGSVEIYAYQLGGKPEALASVMAGKSKSGDYYVSTCSLTNFTSCQHIIDGVINYAAGPLKDQVKLTGDVSDNLAVIGKPVLISYHKEFGLAYPQTLDPKVIAARKKLVQLYNQQNEDKVLLSHIASIPYYTNETFGKALLSRIAQDLQLFTNDTVTNCYKPGDEYSCPTILTEIESAINTDSNILGIIKRAYLIDSDWQGLAKALGGSEITAAYHDGSLERYYFFFNNGDYARFTDPNLPMDAGYPGAITNNNWPGLKTDMGDNLITAAFYNSIEKVSYFFLNNGEYIKYNSAEDEVFSGYPQEINDQNWPGLKQALGNNQIIGAFYDDGKDYFFINDGLDNKVQYIIYSNVHREVLVGPREL